MGQSQHAASLRLGARADYRKKYLCRAWCAGNNKKLHKQFIAEDHLIEKYIRIKLLPEQDPQFRVLIERLNNKRIVTIECLSEKIGSYRSMMDSLKKFVFKKTNLEMELKIGVLPYHLAIGYQMMHNITQAIKSRAGGNLNTTLKKEVRMIMRNNYKNLEGVIIKCRGKINGSAIAGTESYSDGTVKLSTIDKDVYQLNYGLKLDSGILGIKIKYQYQGSRGFNSGGRNRRNNNHGGKYNSNSQGKGSFSKSKAGEPKTSYNKNVGGK